MAREIRAKAKANKVDGEDGLVATTSLIYGKDSDVSNVAERNVSQFVYILLQE